MPYYSFRAAYPAEKKDQVGDTAIWTLTEPQRSNSASTFFATATTVNNLYESNGVYTYHVLL